MEVKLSRPKLHEMCTVLVVLCVVVLSQILHHTEVFLTSSVTNVSRGFEQICLIKVLKIN